ncbi:MAG TPA: hypothetical protein VGE74_12785 [Gemmata sp.]
MAEAVKMAEGPTTGISDYEWLVQNAQRGTPLATYCPLWDERFATTAGKDVTFEWNRRAGHSGYGWRTSSHGRGEGLDL